MTYAIPKARANYEIFNIRLQGAKVWNDVSDDIKLLSIKLNINCRFTNKLVASVTCGKSEPYPPPEGKTRGRNSYTLAI